VSIKIYLSIPLAGRFVIHANVTSFGNTYVQVRFHYCMQS